jgi:hypothetical protein
MADFFGRLIIPIPVRNEERNLAVCLRAIGTDYSQETASLNLIN